mgnify:CR=1 FL=1
MNQWLYLLKPARLAMLTEGPTPEEAETVSRHFAYLQDLTAKGVMILMGRTQNSDESAARMIMEADSAVRAGVMRATLYPYKIALMRGQTE